MQKKTSYSFTLTEAQQREAARLIQTGNYAPMTVPHTVAAGATPDYNVSLYKSGKLLVQGAGAEDFVTFVLEPMILGEAKLGYEEIHHPEAFEPHMGVDESGKGDFFGPMVIAAAYVDRETVKALRDLNVRDSKLITSDRVALDMARSLRKLLADRYAIVAIGPAAYNRLYSRMRNVNRMLAWAHSRAIENLLEKIPSCPLAISDQFGSEELVKRALLHNGRKIRLIQRHRAESDPAVAAASVLARAGFLLALRDLSETHGVKMPKGASTAVQEAGAELVRRHKAGILLQTAKCHFRTADAVLAAHSLTRSVLGPEGAAVSRPRSEFHRPPKRRDVGAANQDALPS